jgi:hypothetical protein
MRNGQPAGLNIHRTDVRSRNLSADLRLFYNSSITNPVSFNALLFPPLS